jgi:N-acetylglucosaminyldiphosphoundecaprenol N-acetyl-beta-D-mannosaminyltransferase
MKKQLPSTKILDVAITNVDEKTILKYLLQRLHQTNDKFFVVTPNPEILVYANKHSDYKEKLNAAFISLPDGIGVFLAGLFLGKPLQERIPGVDFLDFLCRETKEHPVSIGFLGGRGGVAKRTAECLKRAYPWLDIVFAGDEWPEEYFEKEKRKGKNEKQAAIDILFVAFGFPKQEEWIASNLDRLPVRCAMGVGGAFDYISGQVSRAPLFIRFLGFEWLYRLIKEPWRWKRQLALIVFIWLVLKERFTAS